MFLLRMSHCKHVIRAFKAIRRADVVVLVLDAETGLVDQDRILAERIVQEGRACVVVLNKWDAVPDKTEHSYDASVDYISKFVSDLKFADVPSFPLIYHASFNHFILLGPVNLSTARSSNREAFNKDWCRRRTI